MYILNKDTTNLSLSNLTAIKVTPQGRIIGGDDPPLQQDSCVDTVEVPDQPTEDIFLIDSQNLDYEYFPYERNEDEFYESDEQCSDDNSNDEAEWCILFVFLWK